MMFPNEQLENPTKLAVVVGYLYGDGAVWVWEVCVCIVGCGLGVGVGGHLFKVHNQASERNDLPMQLFATTLSP